MTINDSLRLRRHRNACEHYRENWDTVDCLYECYCLRDMPPLTLEEQERCMTSHSGCWREKQSRRGARAKVEA